MSIPEPIPRPFRHLVDDAAIFPPGLAPLPDSVTAHLERRPGSLGGLVGPYIVDVGRLGALAELDGITGLDVSVVITLVPEIALATALCDAAGPSLRSLELRLLPDAEPETALPTAAQLTPSGAETYVEAPRPGSPGWTTTRDQAATHGLRLKFRTGGTESAAFPTEAEVAQWIADAVERDVPFKCTAGLHHALRHTAADTGFEHHGFLNVLLATVRAAGGADREEVIATLADRDPESVTTAVRAARAVGELAAARERFVSFGSCSIAEPYADLASLGLLDPA
ncbi:hypothetical protein [Nocardioides sp. GXZ039]|uniref:hypothetical protein n=1 Tax=Nocardioides sp. GXZ039 TaxID=3136018 RepID=UPI0030F4570E